MYEKKILKRLLAKIAKEEMSLEDFKGGAEDKMYWSGFNFALAQIKVFIRSDLEIFLDNDAPA